MYQNLKHNYKMPLVGKQPNKIKRIRLKNLPRSVVIHNDFQSENSLYDTDESKVFILPSLSINKL